MLSDKHNLNFSISNTIMKNCVKRAISHNPCAVCETAKNNNVIPRENNILHRSIPVNSRRTLCDASSSKHLKKLHAREEIDRRHVNDLSTSRDEIKTGEVLPQDICQSALNERHLSGCDEEDSTVQLTEEEDSSIAAAKILEKYFAICDTVLSNDDSSVRKDQFDKVVKSDERSEESSEKSELTIISATNIADICESTLVHHENDEISKKCAIHTSKKQNEGQFGFPYPNENIPQRANACSSHLTSVKEETQCSSAVKKNRLYIKCAHRALCVKRKAPSEYISDQDRETYKEQQREVEEERLSYFTIYSFMAGQVQTENSRDHITNHRNHIETI